MGWSMTAAGRTLGGAARRSRASGLGSQPDGVAAVIAAGAKARSGNARGWERRREEMC